MTSPAVEPASQAPADAWPSDDRRHATPEEFTDRPATVMTVAGFVAALLIGALSIVPSPYAIGAPGPTFDTLDVVDGVPLVSITGAPTYEASGELRLTTVSISDAGSQRFTMGRVLQGWLRRDHYVLPREDVYGTTEERANFDEASQRAWISSQESATVSALEESGVAVPATLTVADVIPGSNAMGLLQPGDVLIALGGVPLETFATLTDALARVTPGADVDLTIERAGVLTEVSFATLESDDGRAVMGVYIDPEFELPIQVSVQIETVGGPSAGLMFSLAIMDLLSAQDELNGARIAGTGTINADGDVGPIGGIRLKMAGARAAGSTHFLAPVENCNEVVGHIPDGLSVIAVDTLEDAYQAVVSIGSGGTDELPTC